ncbi:MAG: ATP-dependent helicase [Candidatus Brocadiae bacterium]|nr:ATP-dependent helicase [Candidatus Brocadiia bacterium]
MLVIAGAGSGKTRTLVYRVAWLVENGVPAQAILLLTFTNKAAREMLHRAEALLGGAVTVTGGTFHHAGLLALRRHGHAVGLPRGFTIADRGDAADLIGTVGGEVFGKKEKGLPRGEVLLDIVSMAANTGRSIADVVEQRHPSHGDLVGEIERIAGIYAHRKQSLGIVDFDDLLTLWLRALKENEDIRLEYQRRFAWVLVDEYQDTNILQAELVDLLAGGHRNLMVVGDDAQSIYSFRGANFANILRFHERYPDAKIFKLEQNYRSTPQILELANASIARNRAQHAKELFSAQPPGPRPLLVALPRPEDQARYVAERIRNLAAGGLPPDDIAVLYRSHFLSMELQMELARRKIPFEVRSGMRFFEQAHVKDATSYLRIDTNPKDELAWKRVLRLLPGVGKVTADRVWAGVCASADPVGDLAEGRVGVPKGSVAAIRDLGRALATVRSQRDNPCGQLEAVLACGYEQHLQDTYENAHARVQDLRTLASYATRFPGTGEFLSELALVSGGAEGDVARDGTPEKKIVLSTVHQAKGLEWAAVFVIWLVDGRFPDQRALGEGGEEEERRLFYVAATRARVHLELCLPVMAREGAYGGVIQRQSRFLEELPAWLTTPVDVRGDSSRPGGRRPETGAGEDDDNRWMDGDSDWS